MRAFEGMRRHVSAAKATRAATLSAARAETARGVILTRALARLMRRRESGCFTRWRGAAARGALNRRRLVRAIERLGLSKAAAVFGAWRTLWRRNALQRAAVAERMTRVRVKVGGAALRQGLTLVHYSAQRKRFSWGKGCLGGV